MRLVLTVIVSLVLLSACKDRKQGVAISKIKSASKLVTTKTTLKKMIFATQDKKFLGLIKLNQSRFAARTTAYVLAGVDLSKLDASNVSFSANSITLKLPAVEVIDFSYPFSEYKVDYSLTESAFANSISIEDHEELYRRAELQIRETLEYTGIKEATEKRTRQMLESLLRNLGYDEVYISFLDGPFIKPVPLDDNELK
jgi:hypothetical protein